MNKLKCFVLILYLFNSSLLLAQDNNDKKPLVQILVDIQQRLDCQFTFADQTIKNIYISSPDPNLNLENTVEYLRKSTGLKFTFFDGNYITINKINDSFNICGYLVDQFDKTPVNSASIVGDNDATISNAKGFFSLTVEDKNEIIEIRHLSYAPLIFSSSDFKSNSCDTIVLRIQNESLEEVILANYIAKGIDKLSDGSMSINFKKFDLVPGLIETDVLQTVQALPGVQSSDETVSNINIRGGTHAENLLLWDGIKMYQSGHFFGLISMFNPSITSKVSLIKNGTGVDYTDGVSGTILMNTDDKIAKKISGSFGANFTNANAFIDVPLGAKSSVQIAARKAINDFVETPTYSAYYDRVLQDSEVDNNTTKVEHSGITFDFYDTSVRWLYQPSTKDLIRFNFIKVNNKLIFNESAEQNQQTSSRESRLIQNTTAEGLHYQRDWTNKFRTSLQLYETDYRLNAINEDVLKDQRLEQENKVSESSVKFKTIYVANPKWTYINGYQFIESGISNLTDVDDPRFLTLETEVIREHALFSSVDFKSESNDTQIKGGLRYAYIEKFKKHLIEPRLVINQRFADFFNLEIAGELKHQNTSQIINFQNDFLGVEKRRWRLSNQLEVPVIQSKQASLGVSFSNRGWLISATAYHKNVDQITSQSQGFLGPHIYDQSIGSYAVNGMDVLINKRIRKVSSWLSYSYGKNTYTFDEFSPSQFPNNVDITHAVTLGSTFSTTSFKFSAGLNYYTGKPTTRPIENQTVEENTIQYEATNSSRLEDYLRLDASAGYKFKITSGIRAKVGVSIWNVLNQDNVISNFYRVRDNQIEQVTKSALAFTPNAVFSILF
ncbi:TonB-dependent receptor plug domain-containing protein [Aureibaculum sp. 2210JD6-5]|uniref:TonB-dependent receptor plug domain-containing protein n=1 Tax=Aureibaculum sp. 2210JD6-5 TaxID=3103957 RepID=UPI002AAD54FC|nr:TonB-dependent receptor plug domain-containing protein [Aureibaculum sp. 2210JD6-5]MDY7394717.1 TonB-dependent receptor plug domain-containing protein [Aureibaculum sp. 2210JD6-5]